MQADLSLGESGTVSEAAKSRGDYDLLVERAEERMKRQHTDSKTQGHAQERVEEIQSCKMSGRLTTKLVRSEKLWGLPCDRHRQTQDEDACV